jgi:hypothetical protein
VSIIENQAVQIGATLSEELVQQLAEAARLSKNKQHGDAASRIESVRAEAGAAGTLPALQVSLADEYRLAGKEEDARKTYMRRSKGLFVQRTLREFPARPRSAREARSARP